MQYYIWFSQVLDALRQTVIHEGHLSQPLPLRCLARHLRDTCRRLARLCDLDDDIRVLVQNPWDVLVTLTASRSFKAKHHRAKHWNWVAVMLDKWSMTKIKYNNISPSLPLWQHKLPYRSQTIRTHPARSTRRCHWEARVHKCPWPQSRPCRCQQWCSGQWPWQPPSVLTQRKLVGCRVALIRQPAATLDQWVIFKDKVHFVSAESVFRQHRCWLNDFLQVLGLVSGGEGRRAARASGGWTFTSWRCWSWRLRLWTVATHCQGMILIPNLQCFGELGAAMPQRGQDGIRKPWHRSSNVTAKVCKGTSLWHTYHHSSQPLTYFLFLDCIWKTSRCSSRNLLPRLPAAASLLGTALPDGIAGRLRLTCPTIPETLLHNAGRNMAMAKLWQIMSEIPSVVWKSNG